MTKEEIDNLEYKILNYYNNHYGNNKLKQIILKGDKNGLQRQRSFKGKIRNASYE